MSELKNRIESFLSSDEMAAGLIVSRKEAAELKVFFDRQKPMKVILHKWAECPACGSECIEGSEGLDEPRYCPDCGQRLFWEDSDE